MDTEVIGIETSCSGLALLKSIAAERLWVNPVCDLNTRAWDKRLPWQLCCNG